MQWRKRITQSFIVIAIGTIIFLAFAPRTTIVDVVQVKRGAMKEIVEEEGKTRVTDRFIISTPVDGFATRIHLNVGDTVTKTQEVANLEPLRSRVLDPRSRAEAKARVAVAKAALLVSQANVKAAKADADFSNSELMRLSKLYNNKTISLGAFQQAKANAERTAAHLKSSEFSVEVAAFELEAAETSLRYSAASKLIGNTNNVNGTDINGTNINSLNINNTNNSTTEKVSILAPVDGQVLKVYHKSEGVVKAGDPLLEVGDPSSLEVEVDVLSQDAVQITSGTKVQLHRWGGEGYIEGQVRIIEPVGFTKVSALGVEEQRVLVIVDITSPSSEWQRLGDGYRVEANFILWEGVNILQIPSNALFRYQNQWAVFALINKRASLRIVSLGHRNGLSAEIIKGLNEDDVIITHPDDSIYDGKRVRLRR